MKLRKSLPPDRTYEQVLNHYRVEKELANQLRHSSPQERARLLPTLYDELFSRVPDHPRLTARDAPKSRAAAIRNKMKLVRPYLQPDTCVAEFAPGDCVFSHALCSLVSRVYAVDISDQSSASEKRPNNFEFITYNGFDCPIPDASVHLVFSDEFIEHLHPDDAATHFSCAFRILKPGGFYVLRTPHLFYGPHDISVFFSTRAEGFHLREWTVCEVGGALTAAGFTAWHGYWKTGTTYRRMPRVYFPLWEKLLFPLPYAVRKTLARCCLSRKIYIVGEKGSR